MNDIQKNNDLSIKETIMNSWRAMAPNLGLIMVIMLFIFSLNVLISIVQNRAMGSFSLQSVAFIIAASLFQAGLNLGFLRICLNILKNEEANFSTLFNSFHLLGQYILATVIYIILLVCIAMPGIILFVLSEAVTQLESSDVGSFISTTGILLIIISIIYLSIRLQFYGYFIIDKELGPMASILNSAKLSKGHVLELLIIGIALSLIVLVSIIPLGAGLIISLPLSTMATSYLYILLIRRS